ncbi:MAG: Holliday junction resolvase RecU [Lachnospiraceae bacterium]|nr:Holliday junction resolvase RecU [Lachnospiraceae bacterium]
MATWNSRGLRGSELEELINRTTERYRENHLCLIQKVPTPITPVEFDKNSHTIKLAYFGQKSTVDYIGVIQGIPVCFDAKECAEDTFTLRNIHPHQVAFMKEFEDQGGVAFFLIHYTKRNVFYYLTFRRLYSFWRRYENGGRRSFRFEEIEEDFIIEPEAGLFIPYLDAVQRDLDQRQTEEEGISERKNGA